MLCLGILTLPVYYIIFACIFPILSFYGLCMYTFLVLFRFCLFVCLVIFSIGLSVFLREIKTGVDLEGWEMRKDLGGCEGWGIVIRI